MCLALLYFMHKKKRFFLYLSFFLLHVGEDLFYIIMCKRAFCHEMDVVINFFLLDI